MLFTKIFQCRGIKDEPHIFRGTLHKNSELNLWGVAFPTDEPVVYRTQRYRHDVLGERPLQFQQFLGLPTAFHGIALIIGMTYFLFVCYFSWTRKLLVKVSVLTVFFFVCVCMHICSFACMHSFSSRECKDALFLIS